MRKWGLVGGYAGVFLGGVAAGAFVRSLDGIAWETNINLIDLMNLLVAVFIAATVPIWIDRVVEGRKATGGALAEKLGRVAALTDSIHADLGEAAEAAVPDPARRARVISAFRDVNNLMMRVDRGLEHGSRQDLKEATQELGRRLHEFKKAATGNAFPLDTKLDTGSAGRSQLVAYRRSMQALDALLVELAQ